MLRKVLDFLLPPECVLCRSPLVDPHTLCISCFSNLSFVMDPVCEDCGYPLPDLEVFRCASCMIKQPLFDKARTTLIYDDASKAMILRLKHCDSIDFAIPLARLLYHQHREILHNVDYLIPVPLHRWRLWRRRYNQSTLIARALTHMMEGVEEAPKLLCHTLLRIKSTPSQGKHSTSARHKNMQGAFAVREKEVLVGKSVALIDDVFTSGATVKACVRVLKRAGVREVVVLTLARSIKGRDIHAE